MDIRYAGIEDNEENPLYGSLVFQLSPTTTFYASVDEAEDGKFFEKLTRGDQLIYKSNEVLTIRMKEDVKAFMIADEGILFQTQVTPESFMHLQTELDKMVIETPQQGNRRNMTFSVRANGIPVGDLREYADTVDGTEDTATDVFNGLEARIVQHLGANDYQLLDIDLDENTLRTQSPRTTTPPPLNTTVEGITFDVVFSVNEEGPPSAPGLVAPAAFALPPIPTEADVGPLQPTSYTGDVFDPIMAEEVPLRDYIAEDASNIVLVVNDRSASGIPKQELINQYNDKSAIRYACNREGGLLIRPADVVMTEPYFKIDAPSPYLIPVSQLLPLLGGTHQLWKLVSSSPKRMIPNVASRAIISEDGARSVDGQPVNLVSASHCGPGAFEVVELVPASPAQGGRRRRKTYRKKSKGKTRKAKTSRFSK